MRLAKKIIIVNYFTDCSYTWTLQLLKHIGSGDHNKIVRKIYNKILCIKNALKIAKCDLCAALVERQYKVQAVERSVIISFGKQKVVSIRQDIKYDNYNFFPLVN